MFPISNLPILFYFLLEYYRWTPIKEEKQIRGSSFGAILTWTRSTWRRWLIGLTKCGKTAPTSSDFVIRSAVLDDVDALHDVFRRASLTNEGDRDLIAAHPEWLVWDETMLPFARVAVVDGRVVGFASARPVDNFLELEDLFTDPDWMRQGVASALIADIARRGVRIEVTANPHVMAFYESVGFVARGFANTLGGPAPRMHLDVTRVRP